MINKTEKKFDKKTIFQLRISSILSLIQAHRLSDASSRLQSAVVEIN